jgi:phosphoribosylglycinamide formyltransferase 1
VINIAVFASGSGTNFKAIADYFAGHQHITIRLLLCNRRQAPVLERAASLNIASYVFSREELENSEKISGVLVEYEIDFIVLAGFLLKIPELILKKWPERIINIHPALLPKYGGKGMYGLNVHKAVLKAGDRISGITIHMIDEKYDKGSIITQHTCDVKNDDTPETLAERIHQLEHYWYPRIIEKLLIPQDE